MFHLDDLKKIMRPLLVEVQDRINLVTSELLTNKHKDEMSNVAVASIFVLFMFIFVAARYNILAKLKNIMIRNPNPPHPSPPLSPIYATAPALPTQNWSIK